MKLETPPPHPLGGGDDPPFPKRAILAVSHPISKLSWLSGGVSI